MNSIQRPRPIEDIIEAEEHMFLDACTSHDGRQACRDFANMFGKMSVFDVGDLTTLSHLRRKIQGACSNASHAQLQKFYHLAMQPMTDANTEEVLTWTKKVHSMCDESPDGPIKALSALSSHEIDFSPVKITLWQSQQTETKIESFIFCKSEPLCMHPIFYFSPEKTLGADIEKFDHIVAADFNTHELFSKAQQGLLDMYMSILKKADSAETASDDYEQRAKNIFGLDEKIAEIMPTATEERQGLANMSTLQNTTGHMKKFILQHILNCTAEQPGKQLLQKYRNYKVCISKNTDRILTLIITELMKKENRQLLLDFITTRIVLHFSRFAMTADFEKILSDFFCKNLSACTHPRPRWYHGTDFIRK